jgi:hypothetical protein
MNISDDVKSILAEYAVWMAAKLDLDVDFMLNLGVSAKPLLGAEFTYGGTDMYKNSVILPIRNLVYTASVMDLRADTLDDIKLDEPILDYGCGVGFTLLYLKRRGYKELYGYEVPGVQCELATEYLDAHGIKMGVPDKPGTVMCNNVLEHVESPMETLGYLRAMGGRLLANCCDTDDIDHIAPTEERRAVIDSLKKQRQWCDYVHGVML